MISKTDLLKMLAKAQATEEKVVPIYEKHLYTALDWTTIDDDKKKHVRDKLQEMAEDSKKHKKIVDGLINKIKEDSRDAF